MYGVPFQEVCYWANIFEDTIESEWYINDIPQQFFNELTKEEQRDGWFQQDGVNCAHSAHVQSVQFLNIA